MKMAQHDTKSLQTQILHLDKLLPPQNHPQAFEHPLD